MASAVTLRSDFSADELRRLAAGTKNANQSRRRPYAGNAHTIAAPEVPLRAYELEPLE